jgi:quercetin dioxygenase-like cupin family protein
MKKFKLSDSGARGWFVGDFPEAVVRTQDFEVNYQVNEKGTPPAHYHKIVTELQLVTRGSMVVNGELFGVGDIVMLEPGEVSYLEFLEETETVAIKFPSVPGDKYLV